jgi:hypothetical protein
VRTANFRGEFLLVAAAAMLAACTVGSPFVRPQEDSIRLGETTRAQIIERFGKPQEERQVRSDSHLLRAITYFFGNEMEAPKLAGTVCVRVLYFIFSEEIVVGEGFASSCAADHTDFDARKAADIVKGKTRCDDVIASMGRPGGRGIYPAVDNKGELNIAYMFNSVSLPGRTPKTYEKKLDIICDPNGVVRETLFVESGDR